MDISTSNLFVMVFRRAVTDNLGEFSLDGRMLSVLMELDGKQTLGTIAKKTGLSMGAMRKIITTLLELELVEADEDALSVLDKDFINYLNAQLSIAIGPIAGVLVEDAISDLGYSLHRFPSHQAAELIDLLAREIQREGKMITFKQNMVNKIKEKGY